MASGTTIAGRATSGVGFRRTQRPGRPVLRSRTSPSGAARRSLLLSGGRRVALLLVGRAPRRPSRCRCATSPTRRRASSLWQGSWIAALAVGRHRLGPDPVVGGGPPAQAQRTRGPAADALQPADRGPLHRRAAHHGRRLLLLHRARRETDHADLGASPTTDQRRRHPVVVAVHLRPATAARTRRSPARRPSRPTLYLPLGESVQFRLSPTTSSTRSGCRRSCSSWT